MCRRAAGALAGPYLQLQDWVLDQGVVYVDEAGWRTNGESRAVWTATTPEATFLQFAAYFKREQVERLIGTTYPGIVVSDRWNGSRHLDPNQRQVCWPRIQRDFRRHAHGLAEQLTFGGWRGGPGLADQNLRQTVPACLTPYLGRNRCH
jgi:transposase